MKIVTISREFGSGGRELGKRLAQELGWAYYDREIVSAISENSQLSREYVEQVMEQGVGFAYPITVRCTFSRIPSLQQNNLRVLVEQQKVLKQLAQRGENCVIVGRGADVLLREYGPLNLFVYADQQSKLARCRARAREGEDLSLWVLERKIRQVDNGRVKYRQLLTGTPWGRKESYHLCVNTSGRDIKGLAHWLAGYVGYWFGGSEE